MVIFPRKHRAYRWISILLSLLLLITSSGCATKPPIRPFSSPIPEDVRRSARSIAVIPARFPPTTNLLTYAKGRSAGAAKGAGAGALSGLGALGQGGAGGGPYGAAVIVLLLPIFVTVGAMAGGIEGAIKAIPAEEVAKIEAAVGRILQDLDMQNAMADKLVFSGSARTPHRFVPMTDAGPVSPDNPLDVTLARRQGMDMALAVSVLEIGFQGGKGQDPLLSFFMNTRVSAFQASDGRQLQEDIFKYASPQRRFSEWSENGALALREALQAGYAQTAEAAIEKFFLLYEVKMDSLWSVEQHCMLKPLDPPQRSLGFFSTQLNFAEVTSLPPTLKWEPFPRDKDREADSTGALDKLGNITYELKVWKGSDWTPRELIYHRSGITVPEHSVETVMQPDIEYYWAVRAHFRLDGQERLTRWSYSRIPWEGAEDPCRENIVPLNHYHRFKFIPR